MKLIRSGKKVSIDKLPTYRVLVQKDRFTPFSGDHPLGAVTFVFPDSTVADQWCDQLRPHYPEIASIALGDPWLAMRRAASQALAGFQVQTGRFGPSDLFLFMIRAEEAGADLPTILTHIVPPGKLIKSISRVGIEDYQHDELHHWTRFDKLDRNPCFQRKDSPFPDWTQGNPFFEIIGDDTICTIAEVPILGSWISNKGAVPFFSSEVDAENFIMANSLMNFARLVEKPDASPNSNKRDRQGRRIGSFRIVPVYDIKRRLEEIRDDYYVVRDVIDFCFNPLGRRDQMAWGSFFWGDEFGSARDAKDTRFGDIVGTIPGPWVRSISGLWQSTDGNRFTFVDLVDWWTGYDTCFWSGGQVERLLPIRRSLVHDTSRECLEIEPDALDAEVRKVVEEFLAGEPRNEKRTYVPNCRLERFVLVHRNTAVTLERAARAEPTENAISLISHLIWFERTEDRPMRVAGTIDTLDMGFPGSHSEAKENSVGEIFRKAMTRIAVRIVTRGYSPEDANDIVTLCNATFKTTHVEMVGYVFDLLSASNEEQRSWLLNLLHFGPDFWEQWTNGTLMPADPHGLAFVDGHLGEIRSKLEVRSLHFLASALAHLDELGYAPGIDYAPITMEIVKVVETELGAIFKAFKETVQGGTIEYNRNDHNQKPLNDFLFGNRKLMLGNYQALLQGKFRSRTELTERLQSFLNTLPNADYILGEEFLGEVYRKMLHEYRNGGVHDAPVNYETCFDCLETLVGLPEKPGAISSIIAWKTRSPDDSGTRT